MTVVERHPAGHPVWVELATSDVSGARPFYEALFGWTCHDVGAPGPGAYHVWKHQGLDIAGMYTAGEKLREKGISTHWLVYFASEDVDAMAERVRAGQGGILFAPFDLGDAGRSVWCVDQHGALFSGWQAKKDTGIKVSGGPGTLRWVELATPDMDRSIAFYQDVFGWQARESTPEERGIPTRYVEWLADGKAIGGALQMTAEWKGIPPHWVPYFEVADCQAAVDTAQRLGGKAPYGAFGMEGVGKLAVIDDPQQVRFMIIEPRT